MANRLQFKRGAGAPGAILRAGEPAFDTTNNLLYVGLSSGTNGADGNNGQVIGGLSYVERVDDILLGDGNIDVSGQATINDLSVSGIATFNNVELNGSLTGLTDLNVTNLTATGAVTGDSGDFQTLTVDLTSSLVGDVTLGSGLRFGTGTRITGFSTDGALGGPGGASDELVPTQKAVREAIDSVVLGQVGSITLDIGGDTGSGSVGLGSTSSDVLTVRGTPNEIETSATGTTITVGLPDDVTITNNLNVGGGVDITGGIQVGGGVTFNGDITVAPGNSLTVEDLTVTGETDLQGTVAIGQTLTVNGPSNLNGSVVIDGDLTVTGAATSINFEVRDVAIEDRVLELGTEAGGAPTANTGWDLGVAMHYRTAADGAKKAALIWQDNLGFNLAADITENTDSGNDDPQIVTNALANVGVKQLFIGNVNNAANVVINDEKDASLTEVYIGGAIDSAANKFVSIDSSLTSSQIKIENSTFDGGTYGS